MIYNATKSSEVEKETTGERNSNAGSETDTSGEGAVAQPSNLSSKTSPQGTSGQEKKDK